jgi:hypothetical protein
MNRIHHMAAPPGNLSNAPIMIKPELLAGKSTIKTSTEMLRQNQAISSPDEKPSVMVTLGQTNRPVTVVPKVPTVSTVSTDGFSSGSAEYALSVIGVLCIVYGIVAK